MNLKMTSSFGVLPDVLFVPQSPLDLDPQSKFTQDGNHLVLQASNVQHTQHQETRSANGTTSATALWVKLANLPTYAGTSTAGEPIQRRAAPCAQPLTLSELQRAHSPLRYSEFEHELANHPDKAFVAWLLEAIDNGVNLGFSGPRTSHT